ncbi:hypothetical protein F4824DRAFT_454979 [Ustulina deusta]|nr:hypothetical protein F4824DRAFT_454979 [Ustulina deusta]
MQFTTTTAFLGMLLASAPALANPVEVVARQSPVGTCGSQFGAPITAFPIGEACNGNGFACDPSCTDIVRKHPLSPPTNHPSIHPSSFSPTAQKPRGEIFRHET